MENGLAVALEAVLNALQARQKASPALQTRARVEPADWIELAFDQTGRSVPVSLLNVSNEGEHLMQLRAEYGIYMLRVAYDDGTVHVGSVCIER